MDFFSRSQTLFRIFLMIFSMPRWLRRVVGMKMGTGKGSGMGTGTCRGRRRRMEGEKRGGGEWRRKDTGKGALYILQGAGM